MDLQRIITAETTATTASAKNAYRYSAVDGIKQPDFDRAAKLTPSGMVLGWRYAAADAGH